MRPVASSKGKAPGESVRDGRRHSACFSGSIAFSHRANWQIAASESAAAGLNASVV
jgi:hypothetical protein